MLFKDIFLKKKVDLFLVGGSANVKQSMGNYPVIYKIFMQSSILNIQLGLSDKLKEYDTVLRQVAHLSSTLYNRFVLMGI